jgi:glycyl-tRNA synthetase beta chain
MVREAAAPLRSAGRGDPAIIRAFLAQVDAQAPPRSDRQPRWVRPLSGIVAIFGEELVDCEVGAFARFATKGHRFHHPGEITVDAAITPISRACHVIVDHEEREELIRHKPGRRRGRACAGEDQGWCRERRPHRMAAALLGRFDEEFLRFHPKLSSHRTG